MVYLPTFAVKICKHQPFRYIGKYTSPIDLMSDITCAPDLFLSIDIKGSEAADQSRGSRVASAEVLNLGCFRVFFLTNLNPRKLTNDNGKATMNEDVSH